MNRSRTSNSVRSFSSVAERVLALLRKHPYLSALAICLLLDPFCFGATENMPESAVLLETLAVLFGGFLLIFQVGKNCPTLEKALASAILLLGSLVGAYCFAHSWRKGAWVLIGGGVLLLLLYAVAFCTKQNRRRWNVLLILGLSFLLKFYYVLETSITTRQHDVGEFGDVENHAGYIEYLLNHHSLPNFDPREYWQFYHPPLHHIISAVWLSISENIFGMDAGSAQESLQMLTLFYAMAIVITSYRILRHFHLKGIALYAPLLLVAFHPAWILFSGSINNDVLSVAFLLGAVLLTLRWYENPTWKGIVKIALCVGLGMMTKLSVALIAPPIALVFLVTLVQKLRQKQWRILGQFGLFAVVCAPLGLWYPLRNWIRFGVPLTYVQEMNPKSLQYIGDQSFWSRVTDFSGKQFQSVFEQFLRKDSAGNLVGYNEYNPLVAMCKNFLFGEYINESDFTYDCLTLWLAEFFFWFASILAGAALVFLVILCFRKCHIRPMHKVFLVSLYAIFVGSFYRLSADAPFVCTMNSRYITPTILIGALFYGVFLQNLLRRNTKATKISAWILGSFALLFALLSSRVYYVVCMPLMPS